MATLKQKKAIKHIVEGDSVSKAMKKAGYAEDVADNPSKLTKSKAFTEWLEKVGYDDEILAIRLREGLDATKTVVMGKDGNDSFVDIQPDYAERRKNVELGLKLKGHMNSADTNINLNFRKFVEEDTKRYIINDNDS
jgi:hypothetical protein